MAAHVLEAALTSDTSGQLWSSCLWDLQSGTTLATYKGDGSGPRGLCLLGNQYLLSAANNKPLIHVWALQRRDHVQQRMVCGGRVSAMAVSPDGNFVVAGIAEKINIWQVCTGNLLAVLTRHYQGVTCLSFTDDGSHFLSAGDDNLVLVWPLHSVLSGASTAVGHSPEPRHTLSHHSLPVTDLYCGCGGLQARAASASLDQTCKLFEVSSGQVLMSVSFDVSITSVTMDTAETRLFAGGINGNIHQVNLHAQPVQREKHIEDTDDDQRQIFKGHGKQVTCLSVSMDGSQLLSGSHDHSARLWDIPSMQCVRTFSHKGPVTNAMLLQPPSPMLSGRGKPSALLQPFKRHLHIQGQGEDREEGTRDTVDVRLGQYQKQGMVSEGLHQDYSDLKRVHSYTEQKDIQEKSEHVSKQDLEFEVKRLKHINQELYQYAAQNIFNSKGTS
ncbi:PREDICTED: WD repeat-containing protein 18-like [Branchiostoma belcheri]|uniref:WD repeat-containing protein 18-like n=1 Tax=Branchiostoma belcheri TaxID=7741 RepID=A0A6P5A889_BRABE|nr:PREDICTED: WD repeat-containing protein 18-like [Branchiostoma belcheri]